MGNNRIGKIKSSQSERKEWKSRAPRKAVSEMKFSSFRKENEKMEKFPQWKVRFGKAEWKTAIIKGWMDVWGVRPALKMCARKWDGRTIKRENRTNAKGRQFPICLLACIPWNGRKFIQENVGHEWMNSGWVKGDLESGLIQVFSVNGKSRVPSVHS